MTKGLEMSIDSATRHELPQIEVPAGGTVLDRATAVLAVHTDDDGMCAGCLSAWARLAPSPCEQRRWAESVVESCGGADRLGHRRR
jgi:hypothetical protein